jgi:hypothetical protein
MSLLWRGILCYKGGLTVRPIEVVLKCVNIHETGFAEVIAGKNSQSATAIVGPFQTVALTKRRKGATIEAMSPRRGAIGADAGLQPQ